MWFIVMCYLFVHTNIIFSLCVTRVAAEEYTALTLLAKAYIMIDGEPNIFFGKMMSATCAKISKEAPIKVPCPAVKGGRFYLTFCVVIYDPV